MHTCSSLAEETGKLHSTEALFPGKRKEARTGQWLGLTVGYQFGNEKTNLCPSLEADCCRSACSPITTTF
jgi:hypothetical protein